MHVSCNMLMIRTSKYFNAQCAVSIQRQHLVEQEFSWIYFKWHFLVAFNPQRCSVHAGFSSIKLSDSNSESLSACMIFFRVLYLTSVLLFYVEKWPCCEVPKISCMFCWLMWLKMNKVSFLYFFHRSFSLVRVCLCQTLGLLQLRPYIFLLSTEDPLLMFLL